MAGLELTEDLRQQELGDRGARADQQGAGHLAMQLLQPGVEFRGQRQEPFGILERDSAGVGEQDQRWLRLFRQ